MTIGNFEMYREIVGSNPTWRTNSGGALEMHPILSKKLTDGRSALSIDGGFLFFLTIELTYIFKERGGSVHMISVFRRVGEKRRWFHSFEARGAIFIHGGEGQEPFRKYLEPVSTKR